MNHIWKAAKAAAWGAVSFGGLLPFLNSAQKAAILKLCPHPGGVFVAAFPYYAGNTSGNLSLYARGSDYHLVLLEQLQTVCDALRLQHPGHIFLPGVDNSPIPEQRAALLAGIGTLGLHGLLIVPPYGSYVFLGTILTDLPLETTKQEIVPPGCTHCKACQKACPTKALDKVFNPERCLSHISQKKGNVSPEEERLLRTHPLIWGCDFCQLACPLNQEVPLSPLPAFRENLISSLDKDDLALSNRQFRNLFSNRAFSWRGPSPLRRNLALQERHKSSS